MIGKLENILKQSMLHVKNITDPLCKEVDSPDIFSESIALKGGKSFEKKAIEAYILEEFKAQVGQTKLGGCANFLTNLNGFSR